MKLFVDDVREPPASEWIVARTYQEAIDFLQTGFVKILSLDHDLGTRETGYDIAKWIETRVATEDFVPPEIQIHSANPVGRQNIELAVANIKRMIDDDS